MSRTDITFSGVTSPAPGQSPATGQLFLIGRTQRGPVNTPTLIRGIGEYRAVFGERAGFTATNDVLRTFFAEGGSQAYVLRAVGPNPVRASKSLEAGDLVVTAKEYGAFSNAWTAEYDHDTKTLIVVADGVEETYSGDTAAELVAAAASSTTVTVTTGGSLPSADVAEGVLSSGADDYDNAVWATLLGYIPADLGTGSVGIAGVPASAGAASLAAHANSTRRLALTSLAAGATAANAISAVEALSSTTGADKTVVCWPNVEMPDGTIVDPIGYFAGVRARGHKIGPWQSLLRDISTAGFVADVDVAPTAAQVQSLIDARVTFARVITGNVKIDGWYTAQPSLDVATLSGAQFADLLNSIAAETQAIADRYLGRLIDAVTLNSFEGDIKGMLSRYTSARALFPAYDAAGNLLDPGYLINIGSDINTPSTIAAGEIHCGLQLRLTASTELVAVSIAAGDAAVIF